MSEPLKTAYSREEMIEQAHAWLKSHYTRSGCNLFTDRYFEDFGLMVSFITDEFPIERPAIAPQERNT